MDSEVLKTLVSDMIIPIIISVAATMVTIKQTLKKEIKEKIYERREKVYIEVFYLLNRLKQDPYLVYNNSEMITPLLALEPRLKLFASEEVLKALKPIYKDIVNTALCYWKLFDGPAYESNRMARLEYGEETELDLEHEDENYQERHLLNKEIFCKEFNNLLDAMRENLEVG